MSISEVEFWSKSTSSTSSSSSFEGLVELGTPMTVDGWEKRWVLMFSFTADHVSDEEEDCNSSRTIDSYKGVKWFDATRINEFHPGVILRLLFVSRGHSRGA